MIVSIDLLQHLLRDGSTDDVLGNPEQEYTRRLLAERAGYR